MQKVRTFTILPSLPESLKELKTIAYNLYWSWDPEVVELFRRIDHTLWRSCGHNPVALLGAVSQARLEDLAENEGFLCQLHWAVERLQNYFQRPTWFDKVYAKNTDSLIAYFSAEFGIHESLPIYAGGLGLLAGDHLKTASDLGVPLIGVGLLYQKGYFRQYLNTDGWQQEQYLENDFYKMPVELVRKHSGRPLIIRVRYPQRSVAAQIWKVLVGRTRLFLLDTNTPLNSPADRTITASLYGGDRENRIRQEIMLGIGGFKALMAMNIEPAVCHMNEGHAAFLTLERIHSLRTRTNISFDEAVEATRPSNVFTLHTSVKAGNDEFQVELMDKYFASYFPNLGINWNQFLGLGRVNHDDETETFKMPVLALRLSANCNGVSELHGQVSRQIWTPIWPDLPQEEVPIRSITNGIHSKTWLSSEMNALYQRYLGSNWADEVVDKSLWQNIEQIPDEELWRTHQRCKERLIAFCRARLKMQLQRRGSYHTELGWAEEVLNPEALTIGFARRFATYKRGYLLLKDPQRLIKLLTQKDRPVQLIFSGKAHPNDTEGKEIIRQIVHFASQSNLRRRLVFIEDYDVDVARSMAQGVDVWLNTPRRPMEASGTSGMKAALNGVINMSTLDGWWCEAYTPEAGWVIGAGEAYKDVGYQDLVESQTLYNLLENEVIPLFFTRSASGLPRAWISRMKGSVKWIAPRFNTNRMLAEYMRRFYNSAAARWKSLSDSNMAHAKDLATWKTNVKQAWSELTVRTVSVEVDDGKQIVTLSTQQPSLEVGAKLRITAAAKLGKLSPDDIDVEVYHGPVDSWGNITNGSPIKMDYQKSTGEDNEHIFTVTLPCRFSGQHGFALRLLPRRADLSDSCEPGLIHWEAPPKIPSKTSQP